MSPSDTTTLKFYDAVFGALGLKRSFFDSGWAGYGKDGEESQQVFLCPPYDGKEARAEDELRGKGPAIPGRDVQAAHGSARVG